MFKNLKFVPQSEKHTKDEEPEDDLEDIQYTIDLETG